MRDEEIRDRGRRLVGLPVDLIHPEWILTRDNFGELARAPARRATPGRSGDSESGEGEGPVAAAGGRAGGGGGGLVKNISLLRLQYYCVLGAVAGAVLFATLRYMPAVGSGATLSTTSVLATGRHRRWCHQIKCIPQWPTQIEGRQIEKRLFVSTRSKSRWI